MSESEIIKRYDDSKPQSLEESIVFAVMNELVGRSGFDDWFYNIEGGIQAEILQNLSSVVAATIPNQENTIYNDALEWAASWITGAQLLGHGEEVQEFATNMAMSIRAAKRGLTPHAPDKG